MTRQLKNILIFCFVFFSLWSFSQGFKKTYYKPNSLDNYSQDVVMAPNGNIILTGITYDSLNNVSFDRLTLVETDPQGNFLWRKSYGSSKFQYLGYSMGLYKDANCFYAAVIVLDSNNNWPSVLIKFNYNGDTLWQKTFYSGTNNVNLYFYGMNKSVDGGFLIIGIYEDFNLNLESIVILKTDINGNELWRKKIISPYSNSVWSASKIIQDSATKKIVVIGYQHLGTSTSYNSYSLVMLCDSLGNKLNSYSYSGMYGGHFIDLIQTKDKNFIAVGSNNCPPFVSANYFMRAQMVKFDISGNVIWKREYDTIAKINGFQTINEMPSGDLILGQEIDTLNTYSICCLNTFSKIYRMDSNGNIKWVKSFDFSKSNSNQDVLSAINFANDGNILGTVWLISNPQPNPYILIKIDTTGCDSTLAYCFTTGINEQNINGFQIKIYPNPIDENFTIEVATKMPDIEMQLSDITGKEVKRIKLKEEKNEINVSNINEGIYLLSILKNGKVVFTKKIVKQ